MIHPPGSTPRRPRSGARAQTARRLVEASVSPNTRRAYAGALRRLDCLARRPRAPRRDPGRLPRRAARRRPRVVERLDGGGRGVLPRETRRPAHSRRRADRPGARRVPADLQGIGARDTGAALDAVTANRPGVRRQVGSGGSTGAAKPSWEWAATLSDACGARDEP